MRIDMGEEVLKFRSHEIVSDKEGLEERVQDKSFCVVDLCKFVITYPQCSFRVLNSIPWCGQIKENCKNKGKR